MDTSKLVVYIVSSKSTVKQTGRKYFTCLRSKNRVRGGDWVVNRTEKQLRCPGQNLKDVVLRLCFGVKLFLQKAEL